MLKVCFLWNALDFFCRFLQHHCSSIPFVHAMQGRHGRQGSQGLVLGLSLRNRKLQWRHVGEVAATMVYLAAKNLPRWPCNGFYYTSSNSYFIISCFDITRTDEISLVKFKFLLIYRNAKLIERFTKPFQYLHILI